MIFVNVRFWCYVAPNDVFCNSMKSMKLPCSFDSQTIVKSRFKCFNVSNNFVLFDEEISNTFNIFFAVVLCKLALLTSRFPLHRIHFFRGKRQKNATLLLVQNLFCGCKCLQSFSYFCTGCHYRPKNKWASQLLANFLLYNLLHAFEMHGQLMCCARNSRLEYKLNDYGLNLWK